MGLEIFQNLGGGLDGCKFQVGVVGVLPTMNSPTSIISIHIHLATMNVILLCLEGVRVFVLDLHSVTKCYDFRL